MFHSVDDLLQLISKDYGIDYKEMITKYAHYCGLPEKKKRGRRRKVDVTAAMGNADNNNLCQLVEDYVEMEEYTYHGDHFLVDDKNNVYTYDVNAPQHIGYRLVDGSISYLEEDSCNS
jgi:hypothetical protein